MADEIERKWTRGPLAVHRQPRDLALDSDYNIHVEDGEILALINLHQGSRADLTLWAAAPDLYEALEFAMNAMMGVDEAFRADGINVPALGGEIIRARAALLRAHPQTEQQERRDTAGKVQAYENPSSPGNKIRPAVKCLGCGTMGCVTYWGDWCFDCNVKRMKRLDAGFAEIAASIGMTIDDFDEDEREEGWCETCQNTGSVDCNCGGDLCVCEYNGEQPCPDCDA